MAREAQHSRRSADRSHRSAASHRVGPLPDQGIDAVPRVAHAGRVNPRFGLATGAAIAAVVAVILAVIPAGWLAEMLATSGPDATTFLVRRYGASATAGLAVTTAVIARGGGPQRAALLGLAAWFGVQAVVAVWGLATGTVGGLTWLAVFADPLIAAGFLALSGRGQKGSSAPSR